MGGRGVREGQGIRLDNLSVAYNGIVAIDRLCGSFTPGSVTAIVGPNGSGKSTLLKTIAGVLRPTAGTVSLGSLRRRGDIAYLPQTAELDPAFPITVLDTVIAGAWKSIGAFGGASRDVERRLDLVLAAVGLADFRRRQIGNLSAGQQRRALFARMILQDASLILLDEPFAAIDEAATADLLRVVARWRSEARTVITVLHDLDQVRAHFPMTLLLAREQIEWGPTETVLTQENLRRMHLLAEPVGATARPFLRAVV